MTYLISEVKAQELTAAEPTKIELPFIIPWILIFIVFYFLIIRPHNKKMKEHQKLIDDLKKGDKVITSGGIFGVIKEVDTKEDLFEVEIANDVCIKIIRSHVINLAEKKSDNSKKEEKKPTKKSKK